MLAKALIIHIFGANSPRPKIQAITKLLFACLSCLLMSIFLQMQAAEVPLTAGLPKDWLSMLLFTIVTTTLTCTLLFASSSFSVTKLQQIARLLPLSKSQKIIVHFAPQFILAFFFLLTILPALLTVTTKLGLTPALSGFVLITAIMSTYGIVHGPRNWPATWRWLWCALQLSTLLACTRMFPLASELGQFVLQVVFWTSASLSIVQCLHIPQKIDNMYVTSESLPKVLWLPKSWAIWFLAQYIRNKGTMLSCLSGFVISMSISLLAIREQFDPTAIHTLLALFVGAAVADLRGLQKTKSCFGIIALQGTPHFLLQQSIASVLIAMLVSTPLLISAAAQSPISVAEGITYAFLGLGIGILVGTIIVPQNKDVTSQLYASLLIMVLTIVVQRFMNSNIAMGNLLIGSLLLFLSTAVEQYRNNFIWRKI